MVERGWFIKEPTVGKSIVTVSWFGFLEAQWNYLNKGSDFHIKNLFMFTTWIHVIHMKQNNHFNSVKYLV